MNQNCEMGKRVKVMEELKKRVLIIGAGSFIGSALAERLSQKEGYKVSEFDILGIEPEIVNFGDYDVVVQAAGFEPCRNGEKHPELYYEVNKKLAFHTAHIAKACNIKQFIVLSTIDVYGTKADHFTAETLPAPETDYAKSKLEAEKKIQELETDSFHVCVLRFPVVINSKKQGVAEQVSNLFAGVKRRTEQISLNSLCESIENVICEDRNGIVLLA